MIHSILKLVLAFKRILLFATLTVFSYTVAAEMVVILHPKVDVESMNSQTLGRIYAMQVKNWKDGQPIKVFTYSTQKDVSRQFIISNIKMQPHQLERLWNRLIFTGIGRTPTVVSSSKEMIEKVKTTPGAIGYVEMPADLSSVQVLEVGQ